MTTTKKPRAPRYRGKNGEHLTIREVGYLYRLTWMCPNDEFADGADVDRSCSPGEAKVLSDALIEFCEQESIPQSMLHCPFEFESLAQAKRALHVANAALVLFDERKPLPDWAKKAIAEGWAPPKGWKP